MAKETPMRTSQILKNQNSFKKGKARQQTKTTVKEKIKDCLVPKRLIKLTATKETSAIGISLKASKIPNF